MNKTPLLVTAAISSLITAVFVGGIFLSRQATLSSKAERSESTLSQQLSEAQNKLSDAQKTITELEETNQTLAKNGMSGVTFPVVVYDRQGLLIDADKSKIEERLIAPYTDYYKDLNRPLVAISIEVPEKVGEPFIASGIFGGEYTGTEGFIFGEREGNIDYWIPTCMGPCPLTDEFKTKYPEITKKALAQ